MRRSSFMFLVLAFAALALAAVLYFGVSDRAAPPMTKAVAEALVKRGEAAFERRDYGALMDLFAPDTPVMGRRPRAFRVAVERMLREVEPGQIGAQWDDLRLEQAGPHHTIALNVTVSQRTPRADIVYFRTRLTLSVERRQIPRWWGLLNSEEWRITRITSSTPMGLPDF